MFVPAAPAGLTPVLGWGRGTRSNLAFCSRSAEISIRCSNDSLITLAMMSNT